MIFVTTARELRTVPANVKKGRPLLHSNSDKILVQSGTGANNNLRLARIEP